MRSSLGTSRLGSLTHSTSLSERTSRSISIVLCRELTSWHARLSASRSVTALLISNKCLTMVPVGGEPLEYSRAECNPCLQLCDEPDLVCNESSVSGEDARYVHALVLITVYLLSWYFGSSVVFLIVYTIILLIMLSCNEVVYQNSMTYATAARQLREGHAALAE